MFKTYAGTKMVDAKPMTRGEYNEYRGWRIPPNENPADEGYLVEYHDGGQPNHPNHKRYISWSPKDVFERAYEERIVPTDFISRMEVELHELNQKLLLAEKFIGTSAFTMIDEADQILLRQQIDYMRGYSRVLGLRYNRAIANQKKN